MCFMVLHDFVATRISFGCSLGPLHLLVLTKLALYCDHLTFNSCSPCFPLSRGLFFKPICSGVVLVKVNLVKCFIVFYIKFVNSLETAHQDFIQNLKIKQ